MKNFTRITLVLLTIFMFPFIGSISTANGQQLGSLGAHCGATHMNNEKKRMKKEVKCLRRALHENLPGVKLRQSKDGLGAYGCGVKKTGSKPAQIACLRGLLNAPQRGGPAVEKSATKQATFLTKEQAISACLSFHGANDDFTKQMCGDSYNECLSDSFRQSAGGKAGDACNTMHGSPLK